MLNIYINLFFFWKKYITRDKVWIAYIEFLLKSLILFWPKFWGMIPSWNVSGKKQLKYSEGVHQVFKRSTSLVITKQFLQKSLYSQNLIPLVINVASQFNSKPCDCLYDDHRRLIWSLISGPVGLVEMRASWPGHPR